MRSASGTASSMLWVTIRMALAGKSWPPQRFEQLGAEVLRRQHVERAERLVHQQRVRFDDERAGEADPLAHAAGELLRVSRLEAVEADQVDRLAAPAGAARAAGTPAPRGPSSTFCWTVSQGSSAKVWNTIATPGLAPFSGVPR